MKHEIVLIWSSILVGAQVVVAGAALTDAIGKDTAGIVALAVAGCQAATQFYIRGQVTPNV
jgi:hypothetical protein